MQKQVSLKTYLGTVLALLIILFASLTFVRSAGEIGIEQDSFIKTASYVIEKDGSTIKAYSGTTGELSYSGSNATTVIQNTLDALTSGRTWKETVVIKGNFTVNAVITVPSYTVVKIQGKITLADGSNCNMFVTGTNATDVEFIGGELDGNWGNNLASSGIVFASYPHRMRVADMYIHNFIENGVHVNDAEMTRIENNVIVSCVTGLRGSWTDGMISDNHVSRCAIGLYIDGQATTVSGNVFCDNNLGGMGNNYGVFILSQYNVFVGNLIGGSPTGHGVYVASGSDYNEIVANTIILNGVNVEVDSGAIGNNVTDNLGFVTKNSGTATIANDEYLAHGLDSNLNIAQSNSTVLVTPYTTLYDNVPIVVGCKAVNGTHIQISGYWTNGTAITDDAIVLWWSVNYP